MGLLYNANTTYCIKITTDEVAAFGEKLWSNWQSSPSPVYKYVLDSRLERISKLRISLSPHNEWFGDLGQPGELDSLGISSIGKFRFRYLIHALVDAIIRAGLFKELAIQIDEQYFQAYRRDIL